MDELNAVGAHDAAVGLAETMRGSGPYPFPLGWQGEVVLGEGTLDIFGSAIGVERGMVFRALREDRGGEHGGGQRLPEEDVGVEVNEGLLLRAIGDDFAQRPPARVAASVVIELGGHVGEGEPEGVDQEGSARRVRDENCLREIFPSKAYGQTPGEQVMQGALPRATLFAPEGLAPEGPDSAHRVNLSVS